MMPSHPFGSNSVITQQINDPDFNVFYIGFDLNREGEFEYRWVPFINTLQNVILEFALGYTTKIDPTRVASLLCDAANAIYKIDEFCEVRDRCENDLDIDDEDLALKYLKRGEFGELILHLLLRDYHNTIPLISKIYFKDSFGHTVHGFDAVHVDPDSKTLWLGESKLYTKGKNGVAQLIKDIKEHIEYDYLRDEFSLISKKVLKITNIPDKEYWINLMSENNTLVNVFNRVVLPLACTYSSDVYNDHIQISDEFFSELENEVNELKEYFDSNYTHVYKDYLTIILILFPLKSKKEFVKRMHKKLARLQEISSNE